MDKKNTQRQLWEVWPGKNRFYCKGKLMSGPRSDLPYYIASILVLTVIPMIFFIFLSGYFIMRGYYMMTAIDIILYICTIVFYFITSFTEPGIIPRRSVLQALGLKVEQVEFSLCQTCYVYRSKRTHHCRACDNCVEVFDHHCRYLNNCIGARNYKYFFMFISFLSLFCGLTIVICFQFIFMDFQKEGYRKRTFVENEVFGLALAVVLVVVCTLLGLFPTLLCLQHLIMCFTGQTTKERIQGTQGSKCSTSFRTRESKFDPQMFLTKDQINKITSQHIDTIENYNESIEIELRE